MILITHRIVLRDGVHLLHLDFVSATERARYDKFYLWNRKNILKQKLVISVNYAAYTKIFCEVSQLCKKEKSRYQSYLINYINV